MERGDERVSESLKAYALGAAVLRQWTMPEFRVGLVRWRKGSGPRQQQDGVSRVHGQRLQTTPEEEVVCQSISGGNELGSPQSRV